METMIRDDVSGKGVRHEVSETATAGELLQEACTLFGREELDSALEVDGAVVCTGVVGGVSGGEASVGSLGVHSGSSLVLCRSRDRVLAVAAHWHSYIDDENSLPVWAWDDEAVVFALAKADSVAFEFVSERLRTSDSFMRDVVERANCRALAYASAELRSDWEVVRIAVAKAADLLQYACESVRDDKELVLAAVAKRGCSLKYASEAIRADREVVLVAVAQLGLALEYASEELRSDKQVVLTALANDLFSLHFASENVRADREVVLDAVSKYGGVLLFASEELKADKEVVTAAVAADALALRYACESVRDDKELVLTAVAERGLLLEYASEAIRADRG